MYALTGVSLGRGTVYTSELEVHRVNGTQLNIPLKHTVEI